jgi:hypothetical protein
MAEPFTHPSSHRTIRRARIIASMLPLASLALLIGGAAIVGRLDGKAFLNRLTSGPAPVLIVLFIAILLPAYVRIYYVLLLDAKGVFTAAERRRFRESKQRWERYLLRTALAAGFFLLVLGVWRRWL